MEIEIPQPKGLSRRDWMSRVAQSLSAAGLIPPGLAEEQNHGAAAQPANAASHGALSFLNPEQNQTLISLGECIVPGSKASLCNLVIDAILAIESDAARQQFAQALAAFDAEAQRQYGSSFRKLTAQGQTRILEAASAGKGTLAPHFGVVKEWVADAYWSSQQGLRELGWNGRLAWASYEPCTHGGVHS